MLESTLDFLTLVWGSRLGWVDIPSKINGNWIPWSASWPEDKPMIRRRIESCIEDEEEVYFSVCQFSQEGRRIQDTMSSQWLWADLDRIDPVDCQALDLTPTVCWESSPFRYQGLWKLDRRLKPQVLARVNRALSYALSADKGGWDLTQVLRPIGTFNFKYPNSPEVLLVYDDGPEYGAGELYKLVKPFVEPAVRQPVVSPQEWRVRGKVPARARRLLATPADQVVQGERSNRLWELNCLLVESGLHDEEIYDLVVETPWNKWGPGDRLRRDIAKARTHVDERPPAGVNGGTTKEKAAQTLVDEVVHAEVAEFDLDAPSGDALDERLTLPFQSYNDFMSQNLESPRWLVQDLWMAQSHGIIGGEAKSSKSLMAMAMGLSVASGKPFMGDGRFQVLSPGPVLMIQEENTPWDVQDKLRKLAYLYGLIGRGDIERERAAEGSVASQTIRLEFPSDCDLWLMNNQSFDLSQEEYREALEDTIRSMGPAMVIIDPLYLMLGDADTDRASDVRPFQKWLLSLRYRYGCAVVLVHHFGKPRMDKNGARVGHRLLGSGTWYNWVDSAMYCEPRAPGASVGEKPANRVVGIEREWRSHAPSSSLEVRMRMGKPGSLLLRVECTAPGPNRIPIKDVLNHVEVAVDAAGEAGILIRELGELLRVDHRLVRKAAIGSGKFDVVKKRWGRGYSYRLWTAGSGPQ